MVKKLLIQSINNTNKSVNRKEFLAGMGKAMFPNIRPSTPVPIRNMSKKT